MPKRKRSHFRLFYRLNKVPLNQHGHQDAFLTDVYARNDEPLYKLLRDPLYIEEVWEKNKEKRQVAIWRDNDTLTYVAIRGSQVHLNDCCIVLHFNTNDNNSEISFTVTGQSEKAIAETATYFWSLKSSTENMIAISHNVEFNFSLIQPEQLNQLFDANPLRPVRFSRINLSVAQSVALAKLSQPIHLDLHCSCIENDGKEFIDALEHRETSLASLTIYLLHSSDNINRMFQVQKIEKLIIANQLTNEQVRYALCSPVKSIEFWCHGEDNHRMDLDDIDILPQELSVLITGSSFRDPFPERLVSSLLRRVAKCDHITRFQLKLDWRLPNNAPSHVGDELLQMIASCQNLEFLELSVHFNRMIPEIFRILEEHHGMQTLKLTWYQWWPDGEDCRVLTKLPLLLKRNRKIKVIDGNDRIVTDRNIIDKQYALNRFFCGSITLRSIDQLIRPILVREACMRSASYNFQRTALLLYDHVDILFDAF